MSQPYSKKEPTSLWFLLFSKYSLVLTLVIAFFLSSTNLSAQFITKWKTTTPNESITIPTNSSATYDYTVDWGDGDITPNETGDAIHTYATAGEHTVSISGAAFPRIYFASPSITPENRDKIISIDQWGTNPWTSMERAFQGCSKLEGQASDKPELANVESLKAMFNSCTIFNQDIGNWITTNVKNMDQMFKRATTFNQDLSLWNTENVKDMGDMFYGATAFNKNISAWDVSSVQDMSSMFKKATAFNNDNTALTWTSGTGTSQVTTMKNMFDEATAFNQDISSWNVSLVDNMSYMFYGATSFNNNNTALTWISGTGTSKVTKMYEMFSGATIFNQEIGSWNVSLVDDMNNMFYQATNFNKNISNWNVSEVTNMTSMFYDATAFNNDNTALTWASGTGTSNVTGMSNMFRHATSFNQDISSWNVSSVKRMSWMFNDASIFDQNLEGWDVTGLTDASEMFEGIALSQTNYEKLLISWAAQNVNTGVVFGGGNSTYCSPESITAHTTLEGKWTITYGPSGGNTGCTPACSVPTSERDALIALYNSTDGANWTDNSNWNTTAPVKDWFGVTVDCANNTVIIIELTQSRIVGNNLGGPLPAEIKNLPNLTSLDLGNNFITGTIIPEIYSLTALQNLRLSNNILEGEISSQIKNLTQLIYLELDENKLVNSIPKELGGLTSLDRLWLQRNILTGEIPKDLGNLPSLNRLYLNGNKLTGSIPIELTNTSIKYLVLSDNQLSGSVPDFTNSSIKSLAIAVNSFEFGDFESQFNWYDTNINVFSYNPQAKVDTEITISKTAGQTVDMEVECSGDNNEYQWYKGTTPLPNGVDISGATTKKLTINNLKASDAATYHCKVTNTVVNDLTIERHDIHLTVSATACSVPQSERDALIALYNSTDGANWTDNTNWNTSAPVKDWFGVTVDCALGTVIKLELLSNNLDGASIAGNDIDPKIGDLVNLQILDLENNFLTENIPIEVGDLTQLTYLDFHNNKLSGDIPTDLNNLIKLEEVFLFTNSLTGNIPNNWGSINSLKRLYVHENKLNGSVPDFSSSPALTHLSIKDNAFQFGDFENEFLTYITNLGTDFTYNIQAKVDTEITQPKTAGQTVDMEVTCSGDNNVYQWYKGTTPLPNGGDISGATTKKLTINNLKASDAGTYHCKVTNTVVTDLTIERHDIHLTVSATPTNINDFITTWKTTTPGESITIPTYTGETYNYTVDWGDSTTGTYTTSTPPTHLYTTAGEHTVSISGGFPRIYFWASSTSNRKKIIAIEQWGDKEWTSMSSAFYECSNLVVNTTISPNLTKVINLDAMFFRCSNFDTNINDWDVSNVQNMSAMFFEATAFNQNLDNWNTFAVKNMIAMFQGAAAFSGNISTWNTSNVTNMSAMFQDAIQFNSEIGNWNTSRVTKMIKMFMSATNFNQDISYKSSTGAWDTSLVDDMNNMFNRAAEFNQNIGNWNTERVTKMSGMFAGASVFNQNLNTWNTSSVDNMTYMFSDAAVFSGNIGTWNTSSVTNMSYMFFGATEFNQDISYKPSTGAWDTSLVDDMTYMFNGAAEFNQNIGNWDTGKVTKMKRMFLGATIFDQDLGNWNIGNLKNASDMFRSATLLRDNYDALLIGWNNQPHNNNVKFSGGNSLYCNGENARTNLIADGWGSSGTINDAGKDASCGAATLDCPTISSSTTDIDVLPTITWNSITGATNYRVLVLKKSDESVVADVPLGDVQTYTLTTSLEENTIYEVTVFPSDGTTETISCTAIEITTRTLSTTLDCPKITYPLEGISDVSVSPTVKWNASISTVTGYRIVIAEDTNGTNIVDEATVASTVLEYTPSTSLDEGTKYYVTVYAIDGADESTGCTPISFTTEITIPACIKLSTPVDGAINVPLNTTLIWLPPAITNATGYRISIGETLGGVEVEDKKDMGALNSYTRTTNWKTNQTYYVTVTAYNSAGDATGCTEVSFTTETIATVPDCTEFKSPINGAMGVSVNADLTWDANPKATGYRITIGTTSGANNVLDNHDIAGGSTTRYTHTSNWDKNQEYFVTITAYNVLGDATCIKISGFTTETGATTVIPDIPPFFTPNNDGSNDYWQVTDTNNKIKYIRVFDRYGKLLKQFNAASLGWDGIYMGNPMPNSDYWYVITLNTGKQTKGHFSLIRR